MGFQWHKEPRAVSKSLQVPPEAATSNGSEPEAWRDEALALLNPQQHSQSTWKGQMPQTISRLTRLGTELTLTCRSHLWSCLTPLWWELSSAWLLLPLGLPVRQHLQWSLVSLSRWKQNSSDWADRSQNILIWSVFRCALHKNHNLGGFNLKDRNNGKEDHK